MTPQLSNADYQFANWVKQLTLMLAPKNLYLLAGRAGGKTTDILAERMQDVVWDMPGAQFAWAADTYLNGQKNVIPSLVNGWERLGWIEGIHYVIDERPPSFFKKPYKKVFDYKHSITTWNGCHFKIISMDRPSTGAGDSYQHVVGDEAKYIEKKKIDKLFPAARGEWVRFHKSVYYRGHSFTSDMPDLAHSEDEWILDMESRMNPEQMWHILQAAKVINELRIQYFRQKEEQDKEDPVLAKLIEEWQHRWEKVRRNSSFYYNASSFINTDILTLDFFLDALDSLGWLEFKKSVLGIKPTLRKGDSFYPKFDKKVHTFDDGNNTYFDTLGLKDEIKENSKQLRYCQASDLLTGGLDVGNSIWLIIGQRQGGIERALREFHVMPKKWIPDICKDFREFFTHHKKKVLHLYHDRSANQYKKVGQDLASKVKYHIEHDEQGHKTGWFVKLMNENQGNLSQADEYEYMMELLSNQNEKLPQIELDRYNCRNLISSIESAPVIIKTNAKGQKVIHKDKSSEKKYADRPDLLPGMSTNYSDAFKYWLMRRDYINLTKKGRLVTFSDPQVKG